jgi:hypothetical protein
VGELGVAEAEPLDPPPRAGVEVRPGRLDGVALLDDRQHLVEEPEVDATGVVDHLGRGAAPQQLADLEDTIGRRDGDRRQQVVVAPGRQLALGGIGVEPEAPLLQRAQRLLQRLRERAPDRHRLADRLHLRAEDPGRAGQLLERPARDLGDDVVDDRLEAGRRGARDVVGDLVERVPDGQAGGDLGDREAGGLRGERGGPRHPRVHLDDDLAAGDGIEGELDVAATGLDADAADDGEGGVAHGLVLDVGQRLGRGDGDRVAGVHAHRVDVLDRADDHAVVGAVAHDLELELLPPGDRLLDEDLADGAGDDAGEGESVELLWCRCDAGAAAAEDVRRADDDRQADLLGDGAGLVERVGDARARHVEADLDHRLLEALAVLGGGDRLGVGPDHLGLPRHADEALLEQRHGDVEAGLAAERRQHGVGPLALDDGRQHLGRQRLDVGPVGEVRVGHDRGRVRVGEDDAVALLAQHAAGLRAGVVELAGLADHDRAGPDDEDRVEVVAARHQATPAAGSGNPTGSGASWPDPPTFRPDGHLMAATSESWPFRPPRRADMRSAKRANR